MGGRTPCWWLMKTTRPALAVELPPPCASYTQEPSLQRLLLAPSFPSSLPSSLALCMTPLQVPSCLPCGFYLSQQPWEASCPGNAHKRRQIPSMTVSSFCRLKSLVEKKSSDFPLRRVLSSTTPLTYLTGSSKPSRNWRRLLHGRMVSVQ